MPLTAADVDRIEAFRTYIEESVANDDRYGSRARHDREDGSTLATRFEAGGACWFEIALRPNIPQVRVGFVTTDRWKSEEVETAIEESGDSMQEFVGIAMEEVGLDWPEPPVEHYRQAGEYFYFATPLALDELADLDGDEVRDKTLKMLEGYLIAFGPALGGDEEEA